MINSDSNIPQNKVNNEAITSGKSKLTTVEKIIIGILLAVLFLITVAIVKKMMQVPVSHNSLIAKGVRRDVTFIPYVGFKSVVYSISADDGKKASSELLENLGADPEWSPDGKWIMYKDWEFDSNGFPASAIYIQQANGGQKTLVALSGGEYTPTWSSDGKQIAFRGWSTLGTGIYIINVECLLHGESCTPTTRFLVKELAGYAISSIDWSPDGEKLVYAESKNLFIINVDGQSQKMDLIPNFSGYFRFPKWSPDGTKIIGVCSKVDSVPNICMINRDGSNFVYLTNYTTSTDLAHPIWFPDGRKIAYLSSFSVPSMAGTCWDVCPSANAIVSMNIDGSNETQFFLEENFAIEWLTWYP